MVDLEKIKSEIIEALKPLSLSTIRILDACLPVMGKRI